MTLSCGATVLNRCRIRGDTFPMVFTLTDSAGAAIDITGFGFKLTVDPSDEPADDSGNLFELDGVIPIGTDGVVQFLLSDAQADQTPNEYFYDVQMVDLALRKRTIVRGIYEVTQDITKD